MPRYRYKAADGGGRISRGAEESPSIEALERRLKVLGLALISAEEERGSTSVGRRGATKRVLEFTALLSALLEAGLTVKDALDVAVSAAGRKDVSSLAASLAASISSGKPFSAAIEESNAGFPGVYVGLVRIGERTGTLDRIMPGLYRYLEDDARLKDKLSGAMLYPAMVLAVGVFGLGSVLAFVLPRFAEMFASVGAEGAETVRANARAAGTMGIAALGVTIAGIAGLVACAVARRRNRSFAVALDRFLLRMPIIGRVIRTSQALQFSFAMEALTAGGVTVDEALAETAGVLRNAAFAEATLAMREQVRKGATLSRACADVKVFPAYLTQWLAVGERTGQVEKVFSQARRFFQAESDKTASRIMTLAEPAVTVVIGLGVLLMILFFVVPIFGSYRSIAGG